MSMQEIVVGGIVWVDVHRYEIEQWAPASLVDFDGDEIVITGPQCDGDRTPPPPGAPLRLRWTGARGVYTCPTTLVGVAAAPARAWRLRPAGTVEMAQRREYARARFSGPVAVVPMEDRIVRIVKGQMTDLSEGGLRAQLHGRLAAATTVEIYLELETIPVRLSGQVLRAEAVPDAPDTYETVFTLVVSEARAAQLRRTVLRQQMLARQERRSS